MWGMPPPAQRVAHLDRRGRLVADAAIHRGDADAPERLIAGARWSMARVFLPGFGQCHLGGEASKARDDTILGHDRGADTTRGIDVHMCDAAPVEIAPVLIDIPGGTGIAAVRMAGPEADAQAPPQGFRLR